MHVKDARQQADYFLDRKMVNQLLQEVDDKIEASVKAKNFQTQFVINHSDIKYRKHIVCHLKDAGFHVEISSIDCIGIFW